MKLDLLIRLLEGKGQLRGASLSDLAKLSQTLGESPSTLEADQTQAYLVDLSERDRSNTQKLVSEVQDQNWKRANGEVSTQLPIPPSLTAQLPSPEVDFETFMSKLLEDPK